MESDERVGIVTEIDGVSDASTDLFLSDEEDAKTVNDENQEGADDDLALYNLVEQYQPFLLDPADAADSEEADFDGAGPLAVVGQRLEAQASPSAGPRMFSCVEDFYGYLLLRGQKPMTEEHYYNARQGFKIASPIPLPAAGKVRATLAPLIAPWLLPTQTFEADHADGDGVISVHFIPPSVHVRRNSRFLTCKRSFLLLRACRRRTARLSSSTRPFFKTVAALTPSGGQHVPCKGRQAAGLTRFSPCIWGHIP